MGKLPMDLTRTLIAAHIVTALLTATLIGMGKGELQELFICSTATIRSLYLWTFATYPFVHEVSIWLAVDLVMLWWFGSEVETFLGTPRFGWFYAALAIVPAVAIFILAPYLGNFSLQGESEIHFAVFVGFALIYPNAMLLFGIKAKWFAIVFVAIQTITNLSYHQWAAFWYFWITLGLAFFLLHRRNAGGCLAITEWFGRRTGVSGDRTAKRERVRVERQRQREDASEKQIDDILEKISTQGLDSLSERERTILRDASRNDK